ncbi:DegT/DnrJ/EryC1/StrS family aminotransferase [Phaeodactylibacter xiamenensis]|uniref:DegT/DnrJ/EryC1/StrS family aminotransferase n=1 Tax=Phaeodactylibacter xiamenensis TaxID=1524460 RepID=UPI003BAC9739
MNNNNKPIYVTKPSLAPLQDYMVLLQEVWESGILTHNGPKVQLLEQQLKKVLGIDHLYVVSNGTIAIQMAIKALGIKGEIITSPFTWVATLSAIQWEGCTPVFAEIEPDTLNMDPNTIEAQINENTVAIMPVHVFGNPCDVEAIQEIAGKYQLKVIYDAAHAIGSTYEGKSVLNWGDISATSLHATKLLNTAEGGACITQHAHLAKLLEQIRFFGHDDNKEIVREGFNGKLTEVNAALGLANLKYHQEVLDDRKTKYRFYKEALMELDFLTFQTIKIGETNYSYFPIIFASETLLLEALKKLNAENIFPRRYFYPAVNTFNNIVPYAEREISEDISKRIICLPLYKDLELKDMERIIDIIKQFS